MSGLSKMMGWRIPQVLRKFHFACFSSSMISLASRVFSCVSIFRLALLKLAISPMFSLSAVFLKQSKKLRSKPTVLLLSLVLLQQETYFILLANKHSTLPASIVLGSGTTTVPKNSSLLILCTVP